MVVISAQSLEGADATHYRTYEFSKSKLLMPQPKKSSLRSNRLLFRTVGMRFGKAV
ncbi:hypothetical protein NXC12_PE00308 (plasmid) [Rhizobium etli]|uniref:Uncharacterized protein n=1 Tax=Rhizobium etli TaxID=29449 RepID=A0AAN1ENN8_RHIET|nr:hypothetical protein NXC12_PE00308 [Rhizobium etli]